jgi:predicted Zn-dependent protease with MMP-like domain
MREIFGPPLRAAALAALILGLVMLMTNPPSLSGLDELLSLLAGAVAIVLLTAWAVVAAIGREMPEREWRRLVERSERLAAQAQPPAEPASEFDEIVAEAIDELPEELRGVLERTPVIISDRGHEHYAYGHYFGDTVARDNYHDRIVIYRDTLERDFGHDPERLRAEVRRTLRHEIAHHLGWGEAGVRRLGL